MKPWVYSIVNFAVIVITVGLIAVHLRDMFRRRGKKRIGKTRRNGKRWLDFTGQNPR